MFDLPALEAAAGLVHAHMPPTPQYPWPLLAERTGCEVWVKHENHTPTGAFKLRGGIVYMERLAREQRRMKADAVDRRQVALGALAGHVKDDLVLESCSHVHGGCSLVGSVRRSRGAGGRREAAGQRRESVADRLRRPAATSRARS